MSKAIVKYQPNTLIVAALAILIIYLIMRNRGIAQYNAETVTIQRDERGRIAGMTVHRAAH